MVFMGQAGPMKIDLDAMQQRLNRSDYSPVAVSLSGIGVSSPVDLLATYAGRKPDLAPYLKGAEITRDRDLRLQYLAGMGLNDNGAEFILEDMLQHRKYPESLFAASDDKRRALLKALGQ